MSKYIITYLGSLKPMSQEEGQQHMSKYQNWLVSLGNSVISPANPLKNTNTINPDGSVTSGGTSSMSGFSIIEANSEEEALSIAKSCPYLEVGGTLEVSELMEMPS